MRQNRPSKKTETKFDEELWRVVIAASGGTLIESYDFFLMGSLATILAAQFFPKGNSTIALLSVLGTFATGFVLRPVGAFVFGRMGDRSGRKDTFALTLLGVGLSTMLMGVIPGYQQIGIFAPLLLVLLRLVQGFALGGEYGGAVTYVAENAPSAQRGFYTSFIQVASTIGMFVSLFATLLFRVLLSETDFNNWGWRIPFLLSAILVFFSYRIRRQLKESPLFEKIKASGAASEHPVRDSFADKENRSKVLIVIFGAVAGQAVIWYMAHFYSLYFLQTVLNVDPGIASKIVSVALLLSAPFFVVFGSLSDRQGRKKLILGGCAAAVIGLFPIYAGMKSVATVTGATSTSIDSKFEVKTKSFETTRVETTKSGDGALSIKTTVLDPSDPTKPLASAKPTTVVAPSNVQFIQLVVLIWLQLLMAALVYGPMAAFLADLFPVRVRYTSLSVPYNLGNAVFGGLTPLIATAIVTATGNPLAGLAYPIAIALITLVVGAVFIKPTQAVA